MNMSDVLVFLRIVNTIVAFAITVLSLKKSNENPLFKHIASLTAMLGFWDFIRLFLLQTKDPLLWFFMARYLYVCIALSALFLFYYAQSYCMPQFPPLFRKLMAIIPVITCILSITANKHSLFINLSPDKEVFAVIHNPLVFGPWFYVHAIYSYILIFFSCILFSVKIFSPEVKNRGAVAAMTVNAFLFTLVNIVGTFVIQTDIIHLLSLITHLFSINAFYFLTYLDSDQMVPYYGKKDFFQNFNQPVLVFNAKNELLEANTDAVNFFSATNIPHKPYTLYNDIFCECRFAPIKSREQTASVLYLQHIETGKVFLCYKKTILDPKKNKAIGTTLIMYNASMLGNLIQTIEENAFTDVPCACLNRACFELRKEGILNNTPKPCLLLVADIDNLKKVNDMFGHNAGDEYIKIYAAILKKTLKMPNTLFRIGGDEFFAFIPHFTGTNIESIIKKTEALCAKQKKPWNFYISIGFSIVKTADTDFTKHFAQADSDMYRHKQKHKNLPFLKESV